MRKILFLLLFHFPFFAIGQIKEENLYREMSSLEVYVIHNGKKVHIPTPDALFAMGYNWNMVKIVPNGSLNAFPRFNIPSASPTPGSLIFPPIPDIHYPLRVNSATKIISQGLEIQLIEIRGWLLHGMQPLSKFSDGNHTEGASGFGADFQLSLIPDYDWIKAKGMDINKILRVGNIVICEADRIQGSTSKKMITIPYIQVEVNSWFWRDRKPPNLATPPKDWLTITDTPTPWPFPFGSRSISWPFNPHLEAGQYVSIYGSLVTDVPHGNDARWGKECDRWGKQWFINPDMNYYGRYEEHYARYTEIHPADLITVLDYDPKTLTKEPKPQKETIFGLTLYADVNECNSTTVNLSPRIPKPLIGYWKVGYEEILGPECQNPNVGNSAKPHYTKIRRFDDYINVFATTCGGGPFSGTPGRIRALYRVWWEPK